MVVLRRITYFKNFLALIVQVNSFRENILKVSRANHKYNMQIVVKKEANLL